MILPSVARSASKAISCDTRACEATSSMSSLVKGRPVDSIPTEVGRPSVHHHCRRRRRYHCRQQGAAPHCRHHRHCCCCYYRCCYCRYRSRCYHHSAGPSVLPLGRSTHARITIAVSPDGVFIIAIIIVVAVIVAVGADVAAAWLPADPAVCVGQLEPTGKGRNQTGFRVPSGPLQERHQPGG